MKENDVNAGCVIWLEGVMTFMEAEFNLWLEKCFKAGELFTNWPTLVKMVWPDNVGTTNTNVRSIVRLYKDAMTNLISGETNILYFMAKYMRNFIGLLAQVFPKYSCFRC